jgi:hypothetical protein
MLKETLPLPLVMLATVSSEVESSTPQCGEFDNPLSLISLPSALVIVGDIPDMAMERLGILL